MGKHFGTVFLRVALLIWIVAFSARADLSLPGMPGVANPKHDANKKGKAGGGSSESKPQGFSYCTNQKCVKLDGTAVDLSCKTPLEPYTLYREVSRTNDGTLKAKFTSNSKESVTMDCSVETTDGTAFDSFNERLEARRKALERRLPGL